MLHLLSTDFYKLRKAKYFWVCLLITILLAGISVFILDFTYRTMGDQMAAQSEAQQAELDKNGVNLDVEGVLPESYDSLSASGEMSTFFAGNTTLILAFLISLFVGSEFNHGTIKNIATKNYSRTSIYLSKLIVSIAAGIFFTLVYVAVSTVTASILWGFGETDGRFWLDFAAMAGLELLLLSAFISIFVMVSILIRQNGGALAVNIAFLEFLSLFVLLGEMVIKKVFDKSITLSDYLIDTNMTAVATGLDSTIVIRSLCVGIGFLLVSALIGAESFRKRDIK